MPRPPPSLWGSVREALKRGIPRPPIPHPKLPAAPTSYRQFATTTIKTVARSLFQPLPAPTFQQLPARTATRTLPRTPLCSATRLGCRAPVSGIPKVARVGLELHGRRGLHMGAQTVAREAAGGVGLGWRGVSELGFGKREERMQRGRVLEKENKVVKGRKIVQKMEPIVAREEASTAPGAEEFDAFFPVAQPVPLAARTVLLTVSLAAQSPYNAQIDPPRLLSKQTLRDLRLHLERAASHSLKIGNLLDRIPDDAAYAWSIDRRRAILTLRVPESLGYTLLAGRESWLVLTREDPPPMEPDDSRVREWTEDVQRALNFEEENMGSRMIDEILHERVAGSLVLPMVEVDRTEHM